MMDRESVKTTVLVGSLSSWFKVWAAASKAQASALWLVDCCPVATDFLMDLPSGSLMKTPSPPFFAASSADPSM